MFQKIIITLSLLLYYNCLYKIQEENFQDLSGIWEVYVSLVSEDLQTNKT
ncbi:hypothetical protein LEP1GSC115_0092 [Leptospira interrogans serovar Australis str. 200703203]|uniref:Uncharacterized protein n=1 Tax=Leptospira interrogans serovar Australis str. 200703203 TaxID=1085541 RepID=N1UBW1_LEPIR|nr:hypothetical protein LEP1GSC115_0092 [Leptospira interrogans serovar Australis str. 200703203]